VVERFNKTFKDTQAFAGREFDYCPSNPNVGGDHAALWETSYLWYLRPDCVDVSIYFNRPDEEPLIGVRGTDPRRRSSIEIGRKGCELIIKGMIRKAKECMQRTR
ncbi:unnamed protein product, partial [marine sediment metagenome]